MQTYFAFFWQIRSKNYLLFLFVLYRRGTAGVYIYQYAVSLRRHDTNNGGRPARGREQHERREVVHVREATTALYDVVVEFLSYA